VPERHPAPVFYRHPAPVFYRQQAKMLREIAEKAPTGEHRESLLKIAGDYERLADIGERSRLLAGRSSE
jgi:hypothetical protein